MNRPREELELINFSTVAPITDASARKMISEEWPWEWRIAANGGDARGRYTQQDSMRTPTRDAPRWEDCDTGVAEGRWGTRTETVPLCVSAPLAGCVADTAFD